MYDFGALRQRMVDNQIRTSAVTDRGLIQAFLAVPREIFVDPVELPFTYSDRELLMSKSAPGRRLMEPVQLARMVQLLPVGRASKVLTVGCGTGYSAAILAGLGGAIIALEQDDNLAARAADNLRQVGAGNARVTSGRLVEGCPQQGPYDAILIDGAVEVLPDALIAQLQPEGGLAVVERSDRISRAMLYENIGGEPTKWPHFEAAATLLPGFARPREFTF